MTRAEVAKVLGESEGHTRVRLACLLQHGVVLPFDEDYAIGRTHKLLRESLLGTRAAWSWLRERGLLKRVPIDDINAGALTRWVCELPQEGAACS